MWRVWGFASVDREGYKYALKTESDSKKFYVGYTMFKNIHKLERENRMWSQSLKINK